MITTDMPTPSAPNAAQRSTLIFNAVAIGGGFSVLFAIVK